MVSQRFGPREGMGNVALGSSNTEALSSSSSDWVVL